MTNKIIALWLAGKNQVFVAVHCNVVDYKYVTTFTLSKMNETSGNWDRLTSSEVRDMFKEDARVQGLMDVVDDEKYGIGAVTSDVTQRIQLLGFSLH